MLICALVVDPSIEVPPSSGFQVSFVLDDSSTCIWSTYHVYLAKYGHCLHLFLILATLFLICTPNQKPIFELCTRAVPGGGTVPCQARPSDRATQLPGGISYRYAGHIANPLSRERNLRCG